MMVLPMVVDKARIRNSQYHGLSNASGFLEHAFIEKLLFWVFYECPKGCCPETMVGPFKPNLISKPTSPKLSSHVMGKTKKKFSFTNYIHIKSKWGSRNSKMLSFHTPENRNSLHGLINASESLEHAMQRVINDNLELAVHQLRSFCFLNPMSDARVLLSALHNVIRTLSKKLSHVLWERQKKFSFTNYIHIESKVNDNLWVEEKKEFRMLSV
uniref:Uncharacterized protein n=1 Tax=Lactuca sativa TaxID=4236 RepID=A0A9R1XIP7_LACSA|nr:hypothetical protein LSAT_V11C400164860 [Lactuca sativa]